MNNIKVSSVQSLLSSSHLVLNKIRTEVIQVTVKLLFYMKKVFLFQVDMVFCSSKSFLIFRVASTPFLINQSLINKKRARNTKLTINLYSNAAKLDIRRK